MVLVHDAARPLASADLFARVVDAVRHGADAVVPVVAVADTLRRRAGGVVDRDELVAVQTPQGFRAAALRDAHATGAEATDDASLVEAAGRHRGARRRRSEQPQDHRSRGPGRGRGHAAAMHLRVGMGFDVHRTGDDPDRPFVLGGVRFADRPGLVGHSDADAVAHAAADALLGAAGLGDIGEHFPDTDPTWAGADSIGLLDRSDPPGAGSRLGAVERRLHGGRRRAEAGARTGATCRPASPPRSARR